MGSGLALVAFSTKVKTQMKAEKERIMQEGGKIWGGGLKWYNLHRRVLSKEQREKEKGKDAGRWQSKAWCWLAIIECVGGVFDTTKPQRGLICDTMSLAAELGEACGRWRDKERVRESQWVSVSMGWEVAACQLHLGKKALADSHLRSPTHSSFSLALGESRPGDYFSITCSCSCMLELGRLEGTKDKAFFFFGLLSSFKVFFSFSHINPVPSLPLALIHTSSYLCPVTFPILLGWSWKQASVFQFQAPIFTSRTL